MNSNAGSDPLGVTLYIIARQGGLQQVPIEIL